LIDGADGSVGDGSGLGGEGLKRGAQIRPFGERLGRIKAAGSRGKSKTTKGGLRRVGGEGSVGGGAGNAGAFGRSLQTYSGEGAPERTGGRRLAVEACAPRGRPLIGKRVILVLDTLELGGAERQALILARYLMEKAGAAPEVWGLRGSGLAETVCQREGIPYRLVHLEWETRRFRKASELARLATCFRQSKAEVVISYTYFPNVVCGATWRWGGVRLCIWNQRDEGLGRGMKIDKYAVRSVPVFVANSKNGAIFLEKSLDVENTRIAVIPNGVRLMPAVEDRRVWRARLEERPETIVACMVGNLHEFKDHETLLKAWAIVLGQMKPMADRLVLAVAGRPAGTYERLRRLTETLGIQGNVRFLGQIEDVSGLLAAVDIGLFSSRSEGCPNAVLEYMASGLPVVATDIPSIRDCFGENGGARFAPRQDAELFARLTCEYIENPILRAEHGSRNESRAVDEFAPEVMGDRMVNVIVNGLQASRKRGPSSVPRQMVAEIVTRTDAMLRRSGDKTHEGIGSAK
jgi:glycosyltransferase involved in cell wall biosynthesis